MNASDKIGMTFLTLGSISAFGLVVFANIFMRGFAAIVSSLSLFSAFREVFNQDNGDS